ncbi:hypothetical protein THAR02_10937 [Trichoderma harzianum]|uniref:FAD/NAD(P)-binding domain-containing protein n=1 Tax=Trichoderma harzianum TaxID=5544 RepID=A0A0F9X827_TRIHA|nr:hypothetical protein THAR02_10937 [Trichoderma harzianum]
MENNNSYFSPEKRPSNWVPLLNEPSRQERKLRVVCIGGGWSGMTLAHKLTHELKWNHFIDLQIYEKNPDLGGTWYENRYPGAACDVPAHIYVFPFEPNPNWTTFYANSPEIWQYMKDTAKKWDLERHMLFDSKVIDSIWDENSGKWLLKIDHQGEIIEDECDILVNATGFLHKWSWPNIEGLHNFKGKLVHTANWDQSLDWTGQRIALIGNGSSAIQVLPQVQKTSKRVTTYVRSPTWIAANFLNQFSEDGSKVFTEDQRKEFRENPEKLFQLRKKLEHGFNELFKAMVIGRPEQQELDREHNEIMRQRLRQNPELIDRLIPRFTAGCRRLTPGDGYLEALQEDNVKTIWSPIIRVTEKGILTAEGEEKFDIIVTATGFDVSYKPNWNLVGRNGATLGKLWANDPLSYLGIAAPEHPNYFIFAGPNTPVAHGVFPGSCDAMATYILKWCRKIASEDIKSVCVLPNVVDDLDVWSQEMLSQTVWAAPCRSWYKNGRTDGRITALHAGSVIHYRELLEEIRGEDFQIEYRSPNRFRFLGNGFTKKDVNGDDLGYYLQGPSAISK